MDPDLVAARRSTIFQRFQFELTKSSVIQDKISPGKFPTSGVGILKVISILFLLSAAISFLLLKKCPNTSDWYEWLFATATSSSAVITLFFYTVFTFGLAVKQPGFWFISDIAACILTAIFVIIAAIMSMTDCKASNTEYQIPSPLGLCGAALLVIAAAVLYIMYRHTEEVAVRRRTTYKHKMDVFSDV